MNQDRLLVNLTKFTLCVTILVIAMGAYTRLADAGLGCPDWPGCYGQITVPSDSHEIAKAESLFPERPVEPMKAWLEMIHRYLASSLGLLVLAIAYLSHRSSKVSPVLSPLIVITVLLQGALGMWTVTLKLMPVIVMMHLLGGLTLFSLLMLIYRQTVFEQRNRYLTRAISRQPIPASSMKTLNRLSLLALLVVIAQISLGGWTSANYAALMCTTLPICNGDWTQHIDVKSAFNLIQSGHDNYEYGVLDYGARVTIHVAHRLGAMVTTLVLAGLVITLFVQGKRYGAVRQHHWKWGNGIALLLALQITLGISNVVFHLPLANAVAHNLGGAALLVAMVSLNHYLWRISQVSRTSINNYQKHLDSVTKPVVVSQSVSTSKPSGVSHV
jgi:cytochrome c oxidase assembly protein subunit 15